MNTQSNSVSSNKEKQPPILKFNKKAINIMELWTKTAGDFKRILNLSIEHERKSDKLETFTNNILENMAK